MNKAQLQKTMQKQELRIKNIKNLIKEQNSTKAIEPLSRLLERLETELQTIQVELLLT